MTMAFGFISKFCNDYYPTVELIQAKRDSGWLYKYSVTLTGSDQFTGTQTYNMPKGTEGNQGELHVSWTRIELGTSPTQVKTVRSEFLTAVVMKTFIFWDIKAQSSACGLPHAEVLFSLSFDLECGGGLSLRNVPLIFSGLQGIMFQKTEPFISQNCYHLGYE
jgi:hypothetical protein